MRFAVPHGREWWRSTIDGASWADALPGIVESCARDWALVIGSPFESGSVSWVAPVERADGSHAVLKVQFPDDDGAHEAEALASWRGIGAVRLLAFDPGRRALLMERCEPGTALASLDDEHDVLRRAMEVLPLLWVPPVADSTLERLVVAARGWAAALPARWEAHGRPCSRHLVDEAVSLCGELAVSLAEPVVCHQDFHAGNVLSASGGRWLAIDPKPIVGERAFDVALLLRDRRGLRAVAHPERLVRRRLDTIVETLALDRARVRGWAIVHALAWGLSGESLYPDLVLMAEVIATTR